MFVIVMFNEAAKSDANIQFPSQPVISWLTLRLPLVTSVHVPIINYSAFFRS